MKWQTSVMRKVASLRLFQYTLRPGPGQNKYGALQLLIKASLRAQVAKDKLTVPQ